MILTEMLSSPSCQEILSTDCIKAIENFQYTMIEKGTYLAFYLRKTISMSFDAMTRSPVESMNSSIKNGMGVNSNSIQGELEYQFCICMNSYITCIHEF